MIHSISAVGVVTLLGHPRLSFLNHSDSPLQHRVVSGHPVACDPAYCALVCLLVCFVRCFSPFSLNQSNASGFDSMQQRNRDRPTHEEGKEHTQTTRRGNKQQHTQMDHLFISNLRRPSLVFLLPFLFCLYVLYVSIPFRFFSDGDKKGKREQINKLNRAIITPL